MQHYVFLGLNPSYIGNKKTAYHIPLVDDKSTQEYEKVNKMLYESVCNHLTYSTYLVESKEPTWESLISENLYFSSIKKPIKSIQTFIDILNDVKLSPIDVAMYILGYEKCTHLRLQKLVYLVYSQYLKDYHQRLFNDDFYAWELGPVNLKLYKYMKQQETSNKKSINDKFIDDQTQREFDYCSNEYLTVRLFKDTNRVEQIVTKVLNQYKDYSTSELVDLLHSQDSAWFKTAKNNKIEDDDILNSKY